MNYYFGLSEDEARALRAYHLENNDEFSAGIVQEYIDEEGWLKDVRDQQPVSELIENISASSLERKEFKPLQWIVDDLIPEGLTVFAGAPKIGKSFLCWNLALAVSQAGRFLSDYHVTEKKNVLYFALEDPQRQIKNRLLMIQPDTPLPSNLHIYTRFPIALSLDGLDAWQETIEKHQAELVIVDTLFHAVPRSDKGTMYQQDYSILAPIHDMVRRMGISMVLVTHTRKAGDVENPFNMIQGSVGMQAACDTMMMLVRNDGDKVFHVNGREVLPVEIGVEIEHGVFIGTSIEERAEERLSDIRADIRRVLKDAGTLGLTQKAIIGVLPKHSEANIKMTLKRMLRDQQVYQPKPRARYYFEKPPEFQTELDSVPL